jgi:hypothetical protein
MNLHIDPAEFASLIEQTVDAAVRRLLDERATTKPDKILVDKPGAAEILSVSVSTVDRLRKEGLPCITLDGRVLFRRVSLDAWAAAREAGEARR